MTNFDQKLKEKLKQNMEFWDEEIDDINRNEIIDRAYKVDKDLIGILIDDKEIRETFFDKIKEYWVFNVSKFVDYIENIKVLSNSYTKFKNIVGLNVNGKYLNERGEVSLVWPFKDCVLEGGMTKEDQKRNEIFFNEILAKDEIDRLFDAKVLTNFKKYSAKGEEKVKDFNRDEKGTIKDNLIIKGNNLLALHSLKKEFAGKVKLIYIDPPYNTNGDSFKYNDKFTRSTWLTFMKNRLEIARDLLSEDGSIFVNIDYNQGHYLKILMDEIFKEENFRNDIAWQYYMGGKGQKEFGRKHDSILFYSKNKGLNKFHKLKVKRYLDFVPSLKDDSKDSGMGKDEIGYYSIVSCPDVWSDIKSVFNMSKEYQGFNTQKPEALIKRILLVATDKGDLVLDFFGGSGTTASTCHKMGRQYISVEQIESQINLKLKRLKKVIKSEDSGISKAVNWKGGGEFIYCELLKYNEDAIDKIQDAKDTKNLLKIWDEMCDKYFLNYDVEIKKFNDNKKDFEKLTLKQQKDSLVEMLNKNQLYVNLSEIEDSQFKVSKEDKELNKKFYGEFNYGRN